MYYPAFVENNEEGKNLGVTLPDFPGCAGAGYTVEAAIKDAEKAIHLHLLGITEDGEDVPEASTIESRKAEYQDWDGFWVMIEVDVTRYMGTAHRTNISLPSRLITKIDDFVRENEAYKDRSKFLATAAIKLMSEG